MTPAHLKTFECISGYIAENRVAPTYEEIAERLDMRRSRVGEHVISLEAEGYLTRVPGKWRSIRLTEKGEAL